ncbi:acylphosphatase [Desulfurispira natronophila]|uniref:acylphosphatase n=1 Tax=Desulfurispira natronophila TaxID=682562 RepID=A0A7W7Y5V7_9BACT|nr:acylphosphatase [Desulfurispira natronophila]MBB5022377.1 acylphosphatase [Desulfurispira natronophila]
MRTYRIRFFGKVQGVGFRNYVRMVAQSLGVCGVARNMADGSVHVVVNLDDDTRLAFLEKVASGPPLSRIDHMDDAEVDDRSFDGFSIC